MANVVIMPKQGQSVESCIVSEFKKKVGDTVKVGDILFGYETDKATFEEDSKFEGVVLACFFKDGDEIPCLTNVMVIGQPGESFAEFDPNAGQPAAEAPAAAAAAPAAGTLGAVVKTGGVVCTGINTILEVGSAGSIIYNNGEDNEVSIACDKTEAQFAPIGQIFSIMGLGTALKDIGTTGKKILESGYKSLTPKELNDLGENSFGVISYITTSINDYVTDGSVLSGAFKKTDNGVEFALVDTLTGTEKEAADKVKNVLKEAGIDEKKIDEAFEGGNTAKPNGNIPAEIADKILDGAVAKAADSFDAKGFTDGLGEALTEIAPQGDIQDVQNDPTPPEELSDPSNTGDPAGVKGDTSAENGYVWVEPYSYFGASDVVDLYKYLKDVHPIKMEVTPAYCYDNNDGADKDFTNKETFVIDMTAGAETVYETSYVDGDEGYGREFKLTYTFIGDPSDDGKYGALLKVSTKGTIYWRQDGSVYETIDEPDCSISSIRIPKHSLEKSEGKALHIGNGTSYSIDFTIERVYIPTE